MNKNKRVKTDGLDAKALCLKLDRFVQGNRAALALVRVPSEEEERSRAIHRQREQLVKARKRLEAQGRSLMVNHGIEPAKNWWKERTFSALQVPAWMKELLLNTQPILLAVQEKIAALTLQLQGAAESTQPRGLGKMTSVQSCVTKHGNPRLRAALVELAWRLIRFQPNYRAVLKWNRLLAKGALTTGAARKKAIVALARQLAVDLWRIRTGRCSPEALGLVI
jgi:transposase